jgi:hypothetical protein
MAVVFHAQLTVQAHFAVSNGLNTTTWSYNLLLAAKLEIVLLQRQIRERWATCFTCFVI